MNYSGGYRNGQTDNVNLGSYVVGTADEHGADAADRQRDLQRHHGRQRPERQQRLCRGPAPTTCGWSFAARAGTFSALVRRHQLRRPAGRAARQRRHQLRRPFAGGGQDRRARRLLLRTGRRRTRAAPSPSVRNTPTRRRRLAGQTGSFALGALQSAHASAVGYQAGHLVAPRRAVNRGPLRAMKSAMPAMSSRRNHGSAVSAGCVSAAIATIAGSSAASGRHVARAHLDLGMRARACSPRSARGRPAPAAPAPRPASARPARA